MTVHEVAKLDIPALQNVLMFDAIEREWRIGHVRWFKDIGAPLTLACTVEEANDALSDEGATPLMIFTEVTHWARLPDAPGEPA